MGFVVEAKDLIFRELGAGVLFAYGVEEFDACGEGCGKVEDGADLAADEVVLGSILQEGYETEEFEVQGICLRGFCRRWIVELHELASGKRRHRDCSSVVICELDERHRRRKDLYYRSNLTAYETVVGKVFH